MSPFRPFLPPQSNVYPKGPRRLPSLPTTHLATRHSSLATSPLFSYSYELLFPQLLCFDNHPHCPGVWGSLRSISPLATRHSLLPHKPLFRLPAGLLAGNSLVFTSIQNPRGVGVISVRFFTDHRSRVTSHARSVFHESQATSHKSRLFISLPPLWHPQKSQLLCNQANPDSFSKTPGVGVPLCISSEWPRCTFRPSYSPLAARHSLLLPWTP